jgi:hypothetical protein
VVGARVVGDRVGNSEGGAVTTLDIVGTPTVGARLSGIRKVGDSVGFKVVGAAEGASVMTVGVIDGDHVVPPPVGPIVGVSVGVNVGVLEGAGVGEPD